MLTDILANTKWLYIKGICRGQGCNSQVHYAKLAQQDTIKGLKGEEDRVSCFKFAFQQVSKEQKLPHTSDGDNYANRDAISTCMNDVCTIYVRFYNIPPHGMPFL